MDHHSSPVSRYMVAKHEDLSLADVIMLDAQFRLVDLALCSGRGDVAARKDATKQPLTLLDVPRRIGRGIQRAPPLQKQASKWPWNDIEDDQREAEPVELLLLNVSYVE